MADVLGKKISELAETTDLAGLYTIGSDRNNQSKKVPLQFVKEAADYANAQGDYAKGVGDTIQGNTGVNEYPAFSSSTQYAAGSVVRYNNKLYRFTALHPAGAWVGTDAIETSIKAETDVKLTELESKEASNGYGFDKTIQVGTDAAGSFQFPVGYWLNLKKGDKIYIELSDITLDTGAIVAALWTPSGLDTNYQLRYNAGENQPCRMAFTLKEDTTIRGISMNKSSDVESYSATLRFAGNNAAELYENNAYLQSQANIHKADDYLLDIFRLNISIKAKIDAMRLGAVSLKKDDLFRLSIGGTDNSFSAERVIIAGTETLGNRLYDGPVPKEGLYLEGKAIYNYSEFYLYISDVINSGDLNLNIKVNNSSKLEDDIADLEQMTFVFDKVVDIEKDWGARLLGDVAIEKNSNLRLLIGGGFSANRVVIAGTETLGNRLYDGPVPKEGLLLDDITPLDALTSIYVYVSGLTNKGEFKLKIAKSIWGESTTPIYEVGEGKQYTKVIDAFNAAIEQNEEAEIHIFAGVYDIYEEMGGDEFLQSLPSSITWTECNPTFYKKVKIKGIGDVTLKLEISDSMYDSYHVQATRLAIINTVTGIEVDNIDFQIKNCRYCIHDECGGSIYYNGTEHIFTNCKFYFNNGNAAVGIGASASKYLFKGCCFDTDLSSRSLLYFHTWPSNIGALLKFENCVADAGKVHLSIYNNNHKTRVFFENSYFARQNASVIVQPETNEYTTNIFDIICLNVNFDSIGFAESVAENPYTPKFYKW